MAHTTHALAFLKRKYPVPEVRVEWVTQCAQALLADGQPATVDSIHEQFLFSDLRDSTRSNQAAFPPTAHDKILFPQSCLVQIISITEVGSSAFQLHTVLEQRRDVLDGLTKIRGMEEDEDENDGFDSGKLPVYPRGMLKLEVTDGNRVVKAMEYKRIDALRLGETSLGAKLLLRKVRCLRDVLLLAPENTEVLGYQVPDLEAQQPRQFLAGLMERMGKPIPDDIKPATQTAVPARRIPPNNSAPIDVDDDDDSFEMDDSFMRHLDEAEARAVGRGRARSVSSDELGKESQPIYISD
ncbi:RecQ-mediated genome instability protein 1, partial [Tremellales sp. Uapishka_1]